VLLAIFVKKTDKFLTNKILVFTVVEITKVKKPKITTYNTINNIINQNNNGIYIILSI